MEMMTNGRESNRRISNGRVDINYPRVEDQFQFYDKIPAKQCTTFRDPTAGIWEDNILSNIFFSSHNICMIQNGIRAGIYKRSNGKFTISNQDEDTLKIIMRSIFLQNSVNQPDNIKEQIQQLNKIVWDYCIPQIYGEVQGYNQYIKDASTMYTPIAPPIFSKNNDKQLPLHEWF
jgi:hypothetical protein